jgi:hypothetical protein
LQAALAKLRGARVLRARAMTGRLMQLGAPIAYADVEALADGDTVGRPHIARALVDCGFVDSVAEAFSRYLGHGRPAFVARARLSVDQALGLVTRTGGVAVLAHPTPVEDPLSDPKRLRMLLPSLIQAGLGGLECYYPGYTARVVRWLESLARHFELVATGGSDFHGPWRRDRGLGSAGVPEQCWSHLRAAARQQAPLLPAAA